MFPTFLLLWFLSDSEKLTDFRKSVETPRSGPNFVWVRLPNQSNSIEKITPEANSFDFDVFSDLKIMLYGLELPQVIWSNSSLENFFLIFNINFAKNQDFRNQKLDLVRSSNYFCVSSIWFMDCQLSLVEIPLDWVWLTMPSRTVCWCFYTVIRQA